MSVKEIRKDIEKLFEGFNKLDENNKPLVLIPQGATGSATGLPFEKWFQNVASEKIEHAVFGRLDFMRHIIDNYLNGTSLNELRKIVWWAPIQQFTPKNIDRVKDGEEPKLQQALGDIVIKYGDALNNLILINVKATEVSNGEPIGRPPNIVSAFRLLKFSTMLFEEKSELIEKVNVWLVGFYYEPIGNGKVRIVQCHSIDLLKLDLDKAPAINFDAAIQIQWHLGQMIESKGQTLEEFAKKLANKYLDEWESFTNRRSKQMKSIAKKLFSAIKKTHAKKL